MRLLPPLSAPSTVTGTRVPLTAPADLADDDVAVVVDPADGGHAALPRAIDAVTPLAPAIAVAVAADHAHIVVVAIAGGQDD